MKLTNRQKKEIECLDYFILSRCDYSKVGNHESFILITKKGELIDIIEENDAQSPEEAFFEISDKGVIDVRTNNKARLLELLDAKKWRLRMMQLYEDALLEGVTPYFTLLGFEEIPVPESVMKFMARDMFKGKDKELIEELYYNNIKLYAKSKFKVC